jgi:hypothetical protein
MIRDVTELEVFKLAHSLVLEIYKLTESFTETERFSLVSIPRQSRGLYDCWPLKGA